MVIAKGAMGGTLPTAALFGDVPANKRIGQPVTRFLVTLAEKIMSQKFELIFGYRNSAGKAKKVAKISGKKQPNNEIEQLVIIQYDFKLWHFTLHNIEKDGKPTRYHLRPNKPDFLAKEDWERVHREVIQTPLPDFGELSSRYPLQAIPIHAQADDERDFYPTMSKSELHRHSDNLVDLRGKRYDRNTPGLLEFHLVPEAASSTLSEFKESIKGLYLWRLYTGVHPWILSYVRFPNLPLHEKAVA